MGIGIVQLLGKLGKKPIARVGGVRFSHNQKPGELAVAGASLNKQSGFSSTLQFTDAIAQGGTTLHGAHLPIGLPVAQSGFPSETRFTPYAFVRNTTNLPVNVKGKVRYTIENTLESIEINEITLAANEIRKIDLSGVIPTIESQILIDAGIELEHTGQPGAMIAAVASIDQSGDQIIDVPMRDPNSRMSTIAKGGVYPWRIDGGNRAVVHLKNIDSDINGVIPSAIAQIRFDGGVYNLPLLLAEPGQTIAIDINKLRDEQIPDSVGKIIPAHITKGEIVWYDRGELGQFVGRLVQYNTAKGSASSFSYATGCCSGLSSLGGAIVPGNATASLGSSFTYTVIEEFEDQCAGDTISVNVTNRASFSSSNQSVAKASGTIGDSTVQCLGAGNATITATWVTTILQNGGGFCRILRGAASSSSFLLVTAPTVTIGSFSAVGLGRTIEVPITISPSPTPVSITLFINRTTTTGGVALFENGTNTLTINSSTNVKIKGDETSSAANNMILEATIGGATLDTHTFTVIKVTLSLRNSGDVSLDNSARDRYNNCTGTFRLGPITTSGSIPCIAGTTATNIRANGVEIVASVLPSDYAGNITLRRTLVSEQEHVQLASGYTASGPTVGPLADDSPIINRDDNPQSGGSNGKAYDIDAPGPVISSFTAVGDIKRLRQNFRQHAVIDSEVRVSGDLNWFNRVSVIRTLTGDGFSADIPDDNKTGLGTTKLTADLR